MLVAGDAVVVATVIPGQAGDRQGVHQAFTRVGFRYGESENREITLRDRGRSSMILTNIEWKHGIIWKFPIPLSICLAQSRNLK